MKFLSLLAARRVGGDQIQSDLDGRGPDPAGSRCCRPNPVAVAVHLWSTTLPRQLVFVGSGDADDEHTHLPKPGRRPGALSPGPLSFSPPPLSLLSSLYYLLKHLRFAKAALAPCQAPSRR